VKFAFYHALAIFDWIIMLAFSFSGLFINQLSRKLKIIKP
jgi:hypothetical protein